MRVVDLLGASAYALMRYGVSPDDDIDTAINKLRSNHADHLADLLERLRSPERLWIRQWM
ncbi:hypothetical protein [Pyrobaculum sp.]|uniref:hypothetical protein n=1 Tax=Pyrobaculum sp. TaxID=2004705 RepID=UPI00315E17A7